MRVKRFKVKILSFDEMGQEFIRTWKMTKKGKDYEADYDLVLGFPNLSWIAKVLSPERVRIIQMIRDKKPESIRQLAKLLNRAQQNVQKDIQELAQFGIIDLKKMRKKGQKRESLQPQYHWDGFDIAV